MSLKKKIISGILGTSLLLGSMGIVHAQEITHKVQYGDTFWLIAQQYKVSTQELMKINQANENTIIYPGQLLKIPGDNSTEKVHIVQKGDVFWSIAYSYGVSTKDLMAYNGANESTILYVNQKIKIPTANSTTNQVHTATVEAAKPYISYITHTVVKGDDPWKLSLQYGILMQEILDANNLNQNSWLTIGDQIKIPVHHVPVKATPGEQYGEYLDWWTEAQYVLPMGAEFTIVDFYTGKSFKAKRTTGANHSDTEALTAEDTKAITAIWGGKLGWERRPVIVEYKGRKIAASMSSMPHAGNDAGPGGEYTSWRSDSYGPGTNYDWVKNNGMHGHFDLHFSNSTKHKDGEIDLEHQKNIQIAAGIK